MNISKSVLFSKSIYSEINGIFIFPLCSVEFVVFVTSFEFVVFVIFVLFVVFVIFDIFSESRIYLFIYL